MSMPLTEKEWTYKSARGAQPLGFQATPQEVPLVDLRTLLEAIASDPHTPAPTANTARASVWLLDVQAFRFAEDAFLAAGAYESSLSDHRRFLAGLISEGEQVIAAVRETGLMADSDEAKFTLSDLVATLDSLHTTFECEHRPRITPKVKNTVINLFDGPKP